MSVNTTVGSLTIVGANTQTPKVFWKGKEMAEITGIQVIFDVAPFVRLRALNTTNFDVEYAEMGTSNITVMKV